MTKKKLVLHIGTHKTGSTTIQNALENQRDHLARKGIWYARTDREPHIHLAKHCSTYRAVTQSDEAFDKEFAIMERELAKSGCETLLISEEGFSQLSFAECSRFARVGERFDITIICLLRRQDYFLEALWNQYCREGTAKEMINDFITQERFLRRAEYARILDFWSTFSTVFTLSFEEVKKRGVVGEFGKLLGVTLKEPDRSSNVSPDMNLAAMLALLNRFECEFCEPIIIKAFREGNIKYALGSKLRAEVLDRFESQNAQLSAQYGITFDEILPDEPEDSLRYPDPDTTARAMAQLSMHGHKKNPSE